MSPHPLGPTECAPGRAFTHPRHIAGDLRRLMAIRVQICHALEQPNVFHGQAPPITLYDGHPGDAPPPHWRLRLMLLQPARLLATRPIVVVGFVGDKRPHVDPRPMDQIAAAIQGALAGQPDLLSYNTAAVGRGNYVNLVLFANEAAIDAWLESPDHAIAVEDVAPHYYRFIRLYRCRLDNGLHDDNLIISRIKYLDYRPLSRWVGLRDLSAPETGP